MTIRSTESHIFLPSANTIHFKKVLIANRGAIAVRIITTLKRLGIHSVAVYAEADRASLHVELADESYSLGHGKSADTYLNKEKLIHIAKQSQAESIHPGYGFLSENTLFAQQLKQNNIAFIGPSSAHIEQFGLKHQARALAEAANVPLVPGSPLVNNIETAKQWATQIGYPIMLKSTAGGGGIGMQHCNNVQELCEHFDRVQRLSRLNFADDGVFIEKFIANARHIEIQILGNGDGDVISLGDRDCSTQRRNQKVIEECPAPNITTSTREQMAQTACTLMQQVNYLNAGTVEFIYDVETSRFYFLEVNTRLQVEHGVTEAVYQIDIVAWMLAIASQTHLDLTPLKSLSPQGHAIQTRIYAEDPLNNFQPKAGLLTHVTWPQDQALDTLVGALRVDTWVTSGSEVSAFFDPLIAKVISHSATRKAAQQQLVSALDDTELYGIETNLHYLKYLLTTEVFSKGQINTHYLNHLVYHAPRVEVLQAGTQTTLQDYPGRQGYWAVGIPPSGPFDTYAFRLGNRLLNNPEHAIGLEITLQGPSLRFHNAARVVITGAPITATIDKQLVPSWQIISIQSGQTLHLGKIQTGGSRAYLCIQGGLSCPNYLGSASTFTLGQLGGHVGRALRTGDVLHLNEINPQSTQTTQQTDVIPENLRPQYLKHWKLCVTYGPHGAPDFFTPEDIQAFFKHHWEVHYNSNRTGIRLIGPKPQWARSDGGEAGLHPSNIHDNAYAFGTVDFTGDMPVILGPDGPSLGGFVCPATVITADLWKLGQVRAGDTIEFIPISYQTAVAYEAAYKQQIAHLSSHDLLTKEPIADITPTESTPVIARTEGHSNTPSVCYRLSGDHFLLVEYGDLKLDLSLRFRVHALMQRLEDCALPAIKDITPGIRSLQIHFDNQQQTLESLVHHVQQLDALLGNTDALTFQSRIVHLPLSWDDPACQQAIDKYMQSVRPDAPWCPSNLDFIRRINGLDTIDDVKQRVFDASYLVLGLGDVYLGAPVATPINPAHRMVTTKYNPARTWTAENSVGIGGAYLCVYGMEGPGGYQFVGRTLQMWNRYRKTPIFSQPWLLRHFDQIKFHLVTPDELADIRQDFLLGRYDIEIEETHISLSKIEEQLSTEKTAIRTFQECREQAFQKELLYWQNSGLLNYTPPPKQTSQTETDLCLADNQQLIESPLTGTLWALSAKVEEVVKQNEVLLILEAMKMEQNIYAPMKGKVVRYLVEPGQHIEAGQALLIFENEK